ncbi:peptidoglycan-binding protein [Pseudonocardia cypriaca]|uniref:Peptidoglycan-binding protein n=1 Tax=Pseudonocardia cypriaca TaxID=882449 RepID=A0A543GER8_9PSEU|nr:peptidoglycan-binding protein [Pseudonocardia cypriaca]TQM44536.1 hypothetical protein FB388_1906 [Pseudonocardia cypriaca]
MSDPQQQAGLSGEELEAQAATAVPDKEVVSILDLNADIDLAIDAAAPIDLAVAANANVAAPIDAAVGANVLSTGSTAQALSDQGALITQGIDADATAHAAQDSAIDQGNDVVDDGAASAGTAPAGTDTGTDGSTSPTTDGTDGTDGTAGAVGSTVGSTTDAASGALDGDLLNVDVNVDADADVAAPINGAVAANANVAAPIDAAVAANIGSDSSEAVAVSQQDAIINQSIEGSAEATSDQQSGIEQ